MITHHYDQIMIIRAEGARKFLPTIMIKLWSPTIMIIRPLRIYSEQNDQIMIIYSLEIVRSVNAHNWYSFYGSNMSGGRIIYTFQLQTGGGDVQRDE